ncbi:MAG: hypothetical protein ACFNX8_01480 [Lancefieldella rimae]
MPPRCVGSAPNRDSPWACRNPPAFGGGVHEDELRIVHGDEVDAVRAVRPVLLQDLDAPVLQVRVDCLV